MIPMKVTKAQLIEARNSHILCHPKYDDSTLHDDESIIINGDVSMLSTPIECGKRALITDKYVAAAISDKDITIIDPNGNMYPDAAKCINEFLSDADSGVVIDTYKWSINKTYAVGPDKIAIQPTGIPVDKIGASQALANRETNSKLVKFYVDNVMDSVYNHNKSDSSSLWAMFVGPHEQHEGIDRNHAVSFEGDSKQKTLESLLFHSDIVGSLAQQPGVRDVGLKPDSTVIKQSTAKRLLSMYVSSKMGVPYIPMTFKQLKKEVKN